MDTIGIVSATGVVGVELCQLLISNGYTKLSLCASDSSIGSEIVFKDFSYKYSKLNEDFFKGLNVVFFCSNNDISKKWIPVAIENGSYVIDNSSEFRLNEDVPLIIPEINGKTLKITNKLIANPNCSTAILCMALFPLMTLGKIKRVDVSTYQAVSGAGRAGINELENQIKQHVEKIPLTTNTFKSPILGNCFSHNSSVDLDNGYNEEEMKIIKETQKILQTSTEISATCVRIPVFRTHSESVKIVFETPVDEKDIRNALGSFKGIVIMDDRKTNTFPEPLTVSEKLDIYVGRIRKDYYDTNNTTYHMFICGDQLLKGAAYNAFQIYELLISLNGHGYV